MHLQTLLAATALLQTAQAWTFTWRDENNTAYLKNGDGTQPCTQISQAKDLQFDFHPESDPYNFYIWANDNCSGDPQGYSPILWRKNASTDLHSYLVDYGDKSGPVSTAITATATASGTGSVVTSSSAAATTTTASDGEGSGGGLAGGAIAGIVVGVVAGITVLGALFFFLGRRRRQNAAAAAAATGPAPPAPVDQQQGHDGDSGHGGGAAAAGYQDQQYLLEKDPLEKRPVELAGGNHVSEMSNTHAVVEMSNSHSVVEMSDSSRVNELEAPYRSPHQ